MKYDHAHGCAPNACTFPNCECDFPPTLDDKELTPAEPKENEPQLINTMHVKNCSVCGKNHDVEIVDGDHFQCQGINVWVDDFAKVNVKG